MPEKFQTGDAAYRELEGLSNLIPDIMSKLLLVNKDDTEGKKSLSRLCAVAADKLFNLIDALDPAEKLQEETIPGGMAGAALGSEEPINLDEVVKTKPVK